ncbi:RNA polymerase sigma factor [Rubrivivax gelatinosus]|uniref:RNA polymerase sigma-70 factor (ECF subfamily) n=1 Tax=Rubrivivax gelatinosus TaxID=28068 RepID=A0A4R2ME40_RUBGE|nr:RNA polymerase sigma factor [Rubrivivax gelatinosus]MBK1687837.1 RNA polymerase subunit sigma-24 [Rubrivivax gelatinosus]TCP03455.1 RNA polymerase sigma-70 factor (ECF subfamily) [Rubrivivax gelatinosus]
MDLTTTMADDLRAVLARVKAALMRRGRTEHDAEDLLQEAWVRLACYAREQPVDKPEAFLMRAAMNLSIDAYRSRLAHGTEVLLDDVVLVDMSPTAEEVLLARQRFARLSVCLARLSPRSREVFLAQRIEGLSHHEIARRYQISTSTVEHHIAKALLQLTTWMEGW